MKQFSMVKKVVLGFLCSILLLGSVGICAYASEATVNGSHIHQWYFDHYTTVYIPLDNANHQKSISPVYYCSVPGCYEFDLRSGSTTVQSHSMSSDSYTGSNYHSGKLHYFRYERSCSLCGYVYGYWKPISCPGNGHCIDLQSYPVLTDK